jgi:hypothetical protein
MAGTALLHMKTMRNITTTMKIDEIDSKCSFCATSAGSLDKCMSDINPKKQEDRLEPVGLQLVTVFRNVE